MNCKSIPQYELTHYDGSTISTRTISRQEALAVDPQSVDHFMSKTFGIWAFRTTSGQHIRHVEPWHGMGDVCINIIKACQLNPGEFLLPSELHILTNIWSLRTSNNVSARLLTIRKTHQVTHDPSDFFLSRRPMSVAWNKKRTWLWIERIPSKVDQNNK